MPSTAELIRGFDWSATELGPMESWPQALKFALNIAGHSAFPTAIYWGPRLRLIYNDAWAPIPAERHPWALGQPAAAVWSDIWDVIEPQLRSVIETGEGFSAFEQMLPMMREGVRQETYWNYSFTPILGDDGEVAGIFNQGNEVTRAVVNERRLSFQIALADRLRGLSDPHDVKAAAAQMLGEYIGVSSVGFADVDEDGGLIRVSGEWTAGAHVRKLEGVRASLTELPAIAVQYLRAGEVLMLSDVAAAPEGPAADNASFVERVGVRALITVPLVRRGKLRALLYLHEPHVRAWKRSDAGMARDVAERTWAAVERAEVEQKLRASEDHYRHAVELNPQVSWTATPDGQLNRVARRWHDWTGTTGLGDTWANGLHPDDRERTFAVWGHSVATGEPYDIEHRVQHRGGAYRWARSRAFPRRDDEGRILLWYGATEDIHEQKVAEEHQRLLINELNHRVKNTLATVQAIAFQTLKGDLPLAEARSRFEARLLALSRAHNMLTEQSWDGAPLERVVAEALEPLAGEERYRIEGPPLWLAPRAALALALALHELATNAAKYGSLSSDPGIIDVSWRIEADKLHLQWKERCGPAVAEPKSRGFGSRLVEKGLNADLGGSATMHFEGDGMCCMIEASLDAVQAREEELG